MKSVAQHPVISHCSCWPPVHPERDSGYRSPWGPLCSEKTDRLALRYFQVKMLWPLHLDMHIITCLCYDLASAHTYKTINEDVRSSRPAATLYWDGCLVAGTHFARVTSVLASPPYFLSSSQSSLENYNPQFDLNKIYHFLDWLFSSTTQANMWNHLFGK